jgi:hypothetical protein
MQRLGMTAHEINAETSGATGFDATGGNLAAGYVTPAMRPRSSMPTGLRLLNAMVLDRLGHDEQSDCGVSASWPGASRGTNSHW